MTDPITLEATPPEDPHGSPETTPPDESDTQRARTLLETAVTCRPVEEVTALVSLLKEGGHLPDAGYEALRTAAVTRSLQDVQRMVALLGERPHEVVEADITLRAAAVGRSIEDVARLVAILGKDDPGEAERQRRAEAAESAALAATAEPAEPYEEPYALPYRELYDAPYRQPPGHTAPVGGPAGPPARSPVLRHVLRWPVAIALLVSGALHLPDDLRALPSAAPAAFLPLLVTLICLGTGALLALRDTTAVWRAGAVTALGVVALHVLGGSVDLDPLHGAVGGSLTWGSTAVVLCAAVGAVLAGLALRSRQETSL